MNMVCVLTSDHGMGQLRFPDCEEVSGTHKYIQEHNHCCTMHITGMTAFVNLDIKFRLKIVTEKLFFNVGPL